MADYKTIHLKGGFGIRAVSDRAGSRSKPHNTKGMTLGFRTRHEASPPHETHLSQSIHQRDRSLFADVLGQHARIGPSVTRMAFETIAGDHHERVRDHFVYYFLRMHPQTTPSMPLVPQSVGLCRSGAPAQDEMPYASAQLPPSVVRIGRWHARPPRLP